MVSDRKLAANRQNAKKSSGPKSQLGKASSSQNSYRHGLAIPISSNVSLQSEVTKLALGFAGASGPSPTIGPALKAAEAELDLRRIRAFRATIFDKFLKQAPSEELYEELHKHLVKLERYEVRASARRNRALRAIQADQLYVEDKTSSDPSEGFAD